MILDSLNSPEQSGFQQLLPFGNGPVFIAKRSEVFRIAVIWQCHIRLPANAVANVVRRYYIILCLLMKSSDFRVETGSILDFCSSCARAFVSYVNCAFRKSSLLLLLLIIILLLKHKLLGGGK